MDAKAILIWVVIGVVAGWLASLFVGGFLVKATGININLGNALVNEIIVAAIGAIIVVLIARVLV